MDELAQMLGDQIQTRAERDWKSLIEDDEFIPDEAALLFHALEDIFEDLLDRMADHPTIQLAMKEARVSVRELAEDNAAYHRDPLGYVGMSVKDFI